MAAPVAQHPLEHYEAFDVIGNGSFGIIRKVRRKSDGVILARKELNFERMTERDRKQIVAEVNILKDLCHENIVRYHDRYVDRDNGILYILMEYCGGGDLGTIIKNCARANRPLPEDTIWSYFLQILLALQHCHFPTSEGTSASTGSTARQQILHRDLKPENVFLDANQVVKLGDFGLSKALGAAAFANTYVGTPYYMSPELMQERAYDSKSDIWSLGCLIYELCALKPPFHEAKTHNELSIFIRNGRIPPLPRGYSQALHQIIKAMLNINPAMRPSAQQLLQHERLELVFKVHETQKMLAMAKVHKQGLVSRERDLLLRERELLAREESFQQRVTEAVARREAELRVLWEGYEANLRGREEEVARAKEEVRRERELLDMQKHDKPSPPPTQFASPGSAMRGVILTDTGEAIATPRSVQLARILLESPLERKGKENVSPQPLSSAPPTRLRKPSIRTSVPRPALPASTVSLPTMELPHLQSLALASHSLPAASYDLDDENTLPSPFLKRIDKAKPPRRDGTAHDLRVKAATNAALCSGTKEISAVRARPSVDAGVPRPSLERAKQASEDAKKALFRP